MPDLDFHGLRALLEAEARPPVFEEIVRRGARRRRRNLITATAVGVAVALAGTVAVGAVAMNHGAAFTPGPFTVDGASPVPAYPRPTPDGSATGSPTSDGVVAGPHGILVSLASTCVAHCGGAPLSTWNIDYSSDLGRTWSAGQPVDWLAPDAQPAMLVSPLGPMWIVDEHHGDVGASTDNGHSWKLWHVTEPGAGFEPYNPTVAGVTLWLISRTKSYRWAPGTPPQSGDLPAGLSLPATASLDPTLQPAIHPFDADRALLSGVDANGGSVWYRTEDGGRTWSKTTSPCPGALIPPAGVLINVAPDGSIWLVCDGTFQVSMDHGANWTPYGTRHPDIGVLFPYGAYGAWGIDALHVWRAGATDWVDVSPKVPMWKPGTFGVSVAPLDPDRIVIFVTQGHWAGDPLRLEMAGPTTGYVTTDRGATWETFTPGGFPTG